MRKTRYLYRQGLRDGATAGLLAGALCGIIAGLIAFSQPNNPSTPTQIHATARSTTAQR